jgi:STIP1 family protein 1
MCRFHLRAYDGVIADCDACLALDPNSVKAHYFKSKALDSKSLQMTMTHLLRCRSERWKRRERARRREAQDLEREVLEMLERARDREVDDAQGELERTVAREEGDQKMSLMRDIFERARKEDDRKRDVPEWLVDDISFNVMVDPVMVSLFLPSLFLLLGRGEGVDDS